MPPGVSTKLEPSATPLSRGGTTTTPTSATQATSPANQFGFLGSGLASAAAVNSMLAHLPFGARNTGMSPLGGVVGNGLAGGAGSFPLAMYSPQLPMASTSPSNGAGGMGANMGANMGLFNFPTVNTSGLMFPASQAPGMRNAQAALQQALNQQRHMLSRQQSQASPQHHHQAQQQQRLQQQQEQQQQAQRQQAQQQQALQTTAPDRSAAQSVFDSTPTPAGAVVTPSSTSGDAALTFTALGAETPQVDSPTLLAAIRTRARLPSDMMQRVHERNVLYLAHCVAHAITDPDFASSMVASVSPTASRKGGPVISGGAGTSSAASAEQALEVEGVKAGSSTPRSTVSDASGKPPLSSGRVSRRLCPCCSKMQKEARLKFFYGATVRICETCKQRFRRLVQSGAKPTDTLSARDRGLFFFMDAATVGKRARSSQSQNATASAAAELLELAALTPRSSASRASDGKRPAKRARVDAPSPAPAAPQGAGT